MEPTMKATRKSSSVKASSKQTRTTETVPPDQGKTVPSPLLENTVWIPEGTPPKKADELRTSARLLLDALDTTGSVEALGEVAVGLHNLALAALCRSAQPESSPRARETEVSTVIKASRALCDVIKTRDKLQHRARRVISREISFTPDAREVLKRFEAFQKKPLSAVTEETVADEE
jgi:hypothetical protein